MILDERIESGYTVALAAKPDDSDPSPHVIVTTYDGRIAAFRTDPSLAMVAFRHPAAMDEKVAELIGNLGKVTS